MIACDVSPVAMFKFSGHADNSRFLGLFCTSFSLSEVWMSPGCSNTNEENDQDDEGECDKYQCDEDECVVIYIRFLTHSCLTLPSFGYWSLALNNKIGKGNCRYQNLNHKT